MVFKTKADHTCFHKGGIPDWENGVFVCKDKNKNIICPLCGGKKDKMANICSECSRKQNMKRVSKEELEEAMKIYTHVTELAKYFNVSHTTIRKW